jgi:hypothetical protein
MPPVSPPALALANPPARRSAPATHLWPRGQCLMRAGSSALVHLISGLLGCGPRRARRPQGARLQNFRHLSGASSQRGPCQRSSLASSKKASTAAGSQEVHARKPADSPETAADAARRKPTRWMCTLVGTRAYRSAHPSAGPARPRGWPGHVKRAVKLGGQLLSPERNAGTLHVDARGRTAPVVRYPPFAAGRCAAAGIPGMTPEITSIGRRPSS